MQVAELWRYPVKSLGGERLDHATVEVEGIEGDRGWALFDRETGFGLTARRVPELLFATATLSADGTVRIVLPDGTEVAGAAGSEQALTTWLDRPVELRAASSPGPRQYENPVDADDETGPWQPFSGSSGAFHDTGQAAVSLVSLGTLGGWDRRRFRANLVLKGGPGDDDALVGHRVRVGGAELSVVQQLGRCVMVTRPQPDGIDRDGSVLRTLHRERGGLLAVAAVTLTPGPVRVGDELVLLTG